VTQAEFLDLMGYNPSLYSSVEADKPVDSVNWHEAAAFANARSAAEGLALCYRCDGSGPDAICDSPEEPTTCSGYRLPTEAEWEHAARCGTDYVFAGSDELFDVVEDTGPVTLFAEATHPVAQLAPNDCDLYDMSGNVSEWTNDVYADEYYAVSPEVDPIGPTYRLERSVRGGTIHATEARARVSNRQYKASIETTSSMGVRLVRTVPRLWDISF
jgi:formylglycine-generating enzyme required for sulfatase activity